MRLVVIIPLCTSLPKYFPESREDTVVKQFPIKADRDGTLTSARLSLISGYFLCHGQQKAISIPIQGQLAALDPPRMSSLNGD